MTEVRRGRLRIFLGYAAGVGKTYQMLEEAQRLRAQGVDLVIGYVEPHGREDTSARAEGFEHVPYRMRNERGTSVAEMDVAAILARRPAVALVDELAHTNLAGSEREKRWQDVHVLLDAGIDVLTTVNVQHLESLNDQVWHMTGVRVHDTLPDWVMDEADEVVLVDLTPRALRNRLERGVVYAPEEARAALDHFFAEANLTALREMAMRHAAHEVEEKRENASPAAASGTAERILICLTESPSSAVLIRRGKRVADYLGADCLALHVIPRASSAREYEKSHEAMDRHLGFARNLRIATHLLESDDVAGAIADFARAQRITHIFMGRPRRAPLWAPFRDSTVREVVRLAPDRQITIVADRRRD